MATEQEITDRKRVIILLAAGEVGALAMNSAALEAATVKRAIDIAGRFDGTEEEVANYYAGAEMALYTCAVQRLTA